MPTYLALQDLKARNGRVMVAEGDSFEAELTPNLWLRVTIGTGWIHMVDLRLFASWETHILAGPEPEDLTVAEGEVVQLGAMSSPEPEPTPEPVDRSNFPTWFQRLDSRGED